MVKWVTLPNGVIHYNMSLSTTNILIVSVSFSYHSPIVLLSFSYWGSGNNTETIRKQYGIEWRMNEERYCRIVGRTAIKFHC